MKKYISYTVHSPLDHKQRNRILHPYANIVFLMLTSRIFTNQKVRYDNPSSELSADINRTHLRQVGEKIKKACKDLDHQSRRWKGENPSLDHSRFKER